MFEFICFICMVPCALMWVSDLLYGSDECNNSVFPNIKQMKDNLEQFKISLKCK